MEASNNETGGGLSQVKHIVLVLSGKGGVGKSTVTTQLAVGLWKKGYSVGVLDIDLCGPSIPRMFGLVGRQIFQCPEGWVPVVADGGDTQRMHVMSIGFLLANDDDAVVWRGPKKNAMIGQMLDDVKWGALDFLVVDTPPGTSDEHISVIEKLLQNPATKERLLGAVMVTTPQIVSLSDVRRQITMCSKIGVPLVGLVENMSGYVCPSCRNCTNIFSTGGGQALSEEKGIAFLGRLPIDPALTRRTDSGCGFLQNYELGVELNSFVDCFLSLTVLKNV